MSKHAMMFERGGLKKPKKKAVRTSKKSSKVSRQLKALKHQVMNVLGGIGFVAVVIWMFQFVMDR